MTAVFEVLPLQCGYVAARAALRAFVERAIAHGAQAMELRADLGGAILSKRAVVSFGRALEDTRFEEVWSIRWAAENGGPYPEFSGLLSIQHDDYGVAQLEIRGEYLPPFGALGKGFDLVLGQRIASQTCKHLLHELGEGIEQQPVC